MEEAPTPLNLKPEKEEFNDIKEYNICLDNQEFQIQLGKLSSKIVFKMEEKNSINNYYYKADFTLEDLKKINKLFRIFDSITEAFDEINEIFKNKKVIIKTESKEELILCLNISSFSSSKVEDIPLKIKKVFYKKEKTEEILLNEIKQIKENTKFLEKKINFLEQSLNEEKQKNINLEKIVNGLVKENNTFKTIIDELIEWKKETKISIDSKIINNKKEFDFLINRLKKSELYRNLTPTFSLIYRASRDGDDPMDYCNKCNGKKNTLCVIQTKNGCKFGGYTEVVMNFYKGEDVIDPNAFVFSLNKLKIYENLEKERNAVDHCKGWGPIFRNDAFAVYDKKFFSFNKHVIGTKSNSIYGPMNKDYEINNGEKYFSINELEVFQINY